MRQCGRGGVKKFGISHSRTLSRAPCGRVGAIPDRRLLVVSDETAAAEISDQATPDYIGACRDREELGFAGSCLQGTDTIDKLTGAIFKPAILTSKRPHPVDQIAFERDHPAPQIGNVVLQAVQSPSDGLCGHSLAHDTDPNGRNGVAVDQPGMLCQPHTPLDWGTNCREKSNRCIA